ncbi:MAG: molybdopterin-dependent oxidoreductase [Deltaproteobacteria bacterium]|nr:molybdopterin-dependent oxidoreductase [Deltaproteobacteria bacterium]
MELNRRNFIKFLVGGVVGIQATPLPWKFTDDTAIWTQNWPWVPVPPTGAFAEAKSVCNLCPGGCGICVRKVDDRAIKIDGRLDYPVNPGGVCPVGAGGLQLLYDETLRFTGPMKRVGARGEGEFIRISWDEAFKILGERISTLRKNGVPEQVAAVDGNGRDTTVSILIQRFMQAVGSPNYVRTPSIEDTYRLGNRLMQGLDSTMAYDLENSDYVLSFGCGLLEGWGAPGRVMNAWGLWHEGHPDKRGTTITQVESRASNTASKADYWVAPRPGTDGALALGLAHVIIKEGLYDKAFVNDTFGFEDWSAFDGKPHMGFKALVLKKYSPQQVEKITGVDKKTIVKLARHFAKSKAPVALYGKGKDGQNGSLYEFMAVHSLNALVGSIGRAGGVLLPEPLPLSPLPPVKTDAIAREGLTKPRLDEAGGDRYPFAHSLINNFAAAILGKPASPIDTLLVFSANPGFTVPDGGGFMDALKRIPFIVSFSPYRDDTAYMADLILPDSTYLEKREDVVWPVGLQYPFYAVSNPVVDPLYDTRNTGDVIMELANVVGESVGAAFPWEDYEAVLKARVKGLYDAGGGLVAYDASNPPWKQNGKQRESGYSDFDEMWDALLAGGFWYMPADTRRGSNDLFKTPSGRFEFFSKKIQQTIQTLAKERSLQTALKQMGIQVGDDTACMPHYERIECEVDRTKFPLRMMPYEMINLTSGWIPSPPFLYKTISDTQLLKDESFAAVNPATAAEFNLKQRDRVMVESPTGQVKVRIDLFEGAMPGIVYLPLGFGHTAYDEFIKGKGVNPNTIVLAGKDPLSGEPVWWHTPVRLTKV